MMLADSHARAEVRRRPVFREMTPAEVRLAYALFLCTFPCASWDKRFARDMHARATVAAPQISERQAAVLRRLTTKYRRQIRASDLPESERHLLDKAVR